MSADCCSCADAMSEDIFACTSGLASMLLAFVVSADTSAPKSTFAVNSFNSSPKPLLEDKIVSCATWTASVAPASNSKLGQSLHISKLAPPDIAELKLDATLLASDIASLIKQLALADGSSAPDNAPVAVDNAGAACATKSSRLNPPLVNALPKFSVIEVF